LLLGAAPEPSPHGHSDADMQRMADTLSAKLANAPNDPDGWVLLGRTLATLQKWDGARDALKHALTLAPDDGAVHAQLGEVLTLAAGGVVTAEAKAEFAKAPDDARSRFYGAVAIAQSGDTPQALKQLRALQAETPPDAPWRSLVSDEIATLSAPPTASTADEIQTYLANLDTRPGASPAPGGPLPPVSPPAMSPPAMSSPPMSSPPMSAPPMSAPAAPATAPLEDSVRHTPADVRAWLTLSRAYQARGDLRMARDALARANQANPGNIELLLAYSDLLAIDIHDDQLPAALVGVMEQVIAIDPDQPDALWYLGLDAAHRGDSHRARKLWSRLAAGLPQASREHAAVQAKLEGLR
jgi:cytochrome c-type biogenesis protein CcmH